MITAPTAVNWLIIALAFGSTVIGGEGGYPAVRGDRRPGQATSRELSVGLVFLSPHAVGSPLWGVGVFLAGGDCSPVPAAPHMP